MHNFFMKLMYFTGCSIQRCKFAIKNCIWIYWLYPKSTNLGYLFYFFRIYILINLNTNTYWHWGSNMKDSRIAISGTPSLIFFVLGYNFLKLLKN